MKNTTYKTKVKELAAISILSLVLQPALFAGTGAGENVFSIGPRATYFTPKDADEGQWSPGVQARLHLTPGLALEGSVDRIKHDFGPYTTINTYPVQASLLAYLMPGSAVSPFLLVGAGVYRTRVDGPLNYSHTSSRFGLHAGAGLEVRLSDSISIDGSYRYVWLESVASKDLNALDKTYQDTGSMITVALNFLF